MHDGKRHVGAKADSIREYQSKLLVSVGKHREKPDTTMDVVSESVVVENNGGDSN